MGAKADRCRLCGRDVVAIVRTPGGFSRVCGEHLDLPNALSVSHLPGKVNLNYSTTVPDFAKRVADLKESAS